MKAKVPVYLLIPTLLTVLLGLLPMQQARHQQAVTIEPSLPQSLVDNGFDGCSIENSTFLDGEEIVYKIYYNWNFIWTAAGMVHFKVTETEDQYHISAAGSTRGFYDKFYRVRDTFETYLSKETLLPSVFVRDIEEGKYRRYNKFIFDQEDYSVTAYRGKYRDQEDLKITRDSFDNCMHDILSILYHVRNMDFDTLEAGQTFPVEVFLEEHYPLQVKIMEKDIRKKVKGYGKFQTHVFQPQLIAGEVFKEKDQMTVYVSADSNRVPVLIESPLSVGKMKAVLYDHRGLRYDLSSKIE